MNNHIDFVDASGLLDRASGKHGYARDAGRGNAAGENGGASGACTAGQDDMGHVLGCPERKVMIKGR